MAGMSLKDGKQADKDVCEGQTSSYLKFNSLKKSLLNGFVDYAANRKEIETILTCLIYCSTSRTITGEARDAIIELIMRNCEYRALNWAERLVDINGNAFTLYLIKN